MKWMVRQKRPISTARDEAHSDARSFWWGWGHRKTGLSIQPTGIWPANHRYAPLDLSINCNRCYWQIFESILRLARPSGTTARGSLIFAFFPPRRAASGPSLSRFSAPCCWLSRCTDATDEHDPDLSAARGEDGCGTHESSESQLWRVSPSIQAAAIVISGISPSWCQLLGALS